MSKRKKPATRDYSFVLWAGYYALGISVLLSLLFTTFALHISTNGRLLLLLLVAAPLAGALSLQLFRPAYRYRTLAVAACLTIATIIYWFCADDSGFDSQSWIIQKASAIQAFFFVVGTLGVIMTEIGMYFASIKKQPHPPWIMKARDILFPRFSEINYLTLYWCAVLVLVTIPGLLSEFLHSDIRALLMAGVATYLAVRMLTNHVFAYEAKTWITALFYGLLSLLSGISLISQLDAQHWSGSVLHQLNLVITSAFLVVSAVRFITTGVIFRMKSRKYKKLLAERFSDDQFSWKSFLLIMTAGLIALAILESYYTAPEVLILLSYAYTMALHRLMYALKRLSQAH